MVSALIEGFRAVPSPRPGYRMDYRVQGWWADGTQRGVELPTAVAEGNVTLFSPPMDGDRSVGDVEISPGVEERVRGSSGVGKLVAAPTFSPPSLQRGSE